MQQQTGSQRREQILAGAKFFAPIALSMLGARYPRASTIGRVGLGVLEASTSKDQGVPDASRQTEGN